uniref:Uncharacterized protein n=1 Tax=Arundo donax TaxID=35708 RepID=A0A0A9DL09_ARUDO
MIEFTSIVLPNTYSPFIRQQYAGKPLADPMKTPGQLAPLSCLTN